MLNATVCLFCTDEVTKQTMRNIDAFLGSELSRLASQIGDSWVFVPRSEILHVLVLVASFMHVCLITFEIIPFWDVEVERGGFPALMFRNKFDYSIDMTTSSKFGISKLNLLHSISSAHYESHIMFFRGLRPMDYIICSYNPHPGVRMQLRSRVVSHITPHDYATLATPPPWLLRSESREGVTPFQLRALIHFQKPGCKVNNSWCWMFLILSRRITDRSIQNGTMAETNR